VVVDWDATLHESFPQVAPAWEDVIVFFLNTQSLLRFHPLVSCRRVHYLTESFLTGYFGALPMDVARDGQRVLLLWVFSLRCFLGLSRDRPLYLIYNTRLSSRYIRLLRRALIDGKVAVISPDGKAPLMYQPLITARGTQAVASS
jgi:hypothetical protein